MGSSEKFCLRWNDFETNISVAFRELREEKDFFDVTLACEDNQIQAHKVILSACSPFFRNILRRNPHQHPLLYLKGVKYQELQSVLNFMYMGEVNVAQEELNSFLSVAEDLKVKGLTQNNAKSSSEELSKSSNRMTREPPDRQIEATPAPPPPKRPAPRPAPRTETYQYKQQPEEIDDDIQEVVPVKSEPMVEQQHQPQVQQQVAMGGGQEQYEQEQQQGTVALDTEAYQEEESYDYGDYGAGGYEEGGEGYDSNTGMSNSQSGNKVDDPAVAQQIKDMIVCLRPTNNEKYPTYQCSVCHYVSKKKTSVFSHIQSSHTDFPGYNCELCGSFAKTLNAIQQHKLKCSKSKGNTW